VWPGQCPLQFNTDQTTAAALDQVLSLDALKDQASKLCWRSADKARTSRRLLRPSSSSFKRACATRPSKERKEVATFKRRPHRGATDQCHHPAIKPGIFSLARLAPSPHVVLDA